MKCSAEEGVAAAHHDRIRIVKSGRPTTWPDIWLPRLRGCVQAGDVRGALRLLQVLVPSYSPSALHDVQPGEATEPVRPAAGRDRVSAA